MDRLEKRLRRYKRRLKKHHASAARAGDADFAAIDYLIRRDDEHDVDDTELAPAIVAETQTTISRADGRRRGDGDGPGKQAVSHLQECGPWPP